MKRRSYELGYALLIIVLITLGYLWAVTWQGGIPASSALLGHSLGILGFVLMLMTETLYSLRKRSRSARWGRMSTWLQFHIITGLVGPYLVLLHTAWKFNGLAGVVTLLMGAVVLSGFVGRYIYTAVPRTADGAEIQARELERQIAAAEEELQRWLTGRPATEQALVRRLIALPDESQSGILLVLGRTLLEWNYRRQWRRAQRRLGAAAKAQAKELDRLLRRRRALRRQVESLAAARHMLAVWRTVHIPLGVVLFTTALVHIGAALYYATLLK